MSEVPLYRDLAAGTGSGDDKAGGGEFEHAILKLTCWVSRTKTVKSGAE